MHYRLVRVLAIGLAASSFTAVVLAQTVYTVTTDVSHAYDAPQDIDSASVEVDDGSQVVIHPFSEVKDSFAAGSVFRKRGAGYLRSSPSMFGFSGEIRIEEGGFMVVTNRCLGPTDKELANPIIVSNGASIVICPTLATCPDDNLRMRNQMTFAGNGYEGRGAICYAMGKGCSLKNQGFSGDWTLAGDAMIGVDTSEYVNHPGLRHLYLKGNVLTVKQMGDKAGTFVLPQGVIAGGAGANVLFDGPNLSPLIQDTNRDWWTGDADNGLMLTNGADMVWYVFDPRPWWSLVVNEGSELRISGQEKYPCNLGAAERYGSWGGPLRINADTFQIHGEAPLQGAWFLGHVSGRGGISASDMWLKLSCATNSFVGSVSVSCVRKSYETGLALYANGAIPANGGGIAVTNATTYLGAEEAFALPKLTYEVTSGTVSVSGLATRVTAPSLLKTGGGTLDMSTLPMAVTGLVDVRDGTLKVCGRAIDAADASRLHSAVPGLWCGVSPDESGSGADATVVYSNFVDSCFAMMREHTYPPWTRSRPTVWGGYIWNRSPTNETWTFAVSVRAQGRVYVDGAVVANNDDYSNVALGNKVMTPGPHLFRFAVNPRKAAEPGSGIPSLDKGWVWASEMGLAIDRHGRRSTDSNDYFFPSNAVVAGASGFAIEGGDGSLFTRDARERSDFTDAELVAAMHATVLGRVAMDEDATLDLCGMSDCVPFPLQDFTGGGTVANGSAMIYGIWTLSTAKRHPVGLRVPAGDLVFGSQAMVDCDVDGIKPKSDGYVIAYASGVLEGMPVLSSRMREAGWHLEIRDGHKLVLYRPIGLFVIVR